MYISFVTRTIPEKQILTSCLFCWTSMEVFTFISGGNLNKRTARSGKQRMEWLLRCSSEVLKKILLF